MSISADRVPDGASGRLSFEAKAPGPALPAAWCPAPATGRPAAASTHGVVVAVDGPSASGKSSTSRAVARVLGLRYLDTGAMYRALTWWLLDQDVAVDDPAAVAAQADRPRIEVGIDPDAPWVAVDGRDVSAEIRTREVSAAVSAVAAVPRVRAHLIAQQRAIIAAARRDHGGAVVEGRDIGTVVAPDAVVKVYLTASTTARAHRRTAELAHDPAATPRRTEADQARRDRLDAPQSMRAADAVQIDSTRHGLDDVVQMIVGLVRECAATPAAARPAR